MHVSVDLLDSSVLITSNLHTASLITKNYPPVLKYVYGGGNVQDDRGAWSQASEYKGVAKLANQRKIQQTDSKGTAGSSRTW